MWKKILLAGALLQAGAGAQEISHTRLYAAAGLGFVNLKKEGLGIDVPLGSEIVLFAEARWDEAEDELSGDFADLGALDLSGREFSGGLSWRF